MNWRWSILLLLPLLGLGAYTFYPHDDGVEAFLAAHWAHPIAPQGRPPEGFSALEASLDPQACGRCHSEQYRDWRSSLHSQTMGAGIAWQLRLADAKTTQECLRCHAPLGEQLALQAQVRGLSTVRSAPPTHIPANLHRQGLVCAACHLRGHTRYGPEAGPGALEGQAHNGFVAQRAFSDSRFCATCHQFPEGGPRLGGKLREDTYAQWQASAHAAAGRQCQSCHMPERRHLWRGIHDPEMSASALSFAPSVTQAEGGARLVAVRATNSGAGHHLPAYLVAELVLYLEWLDEAGVVHPLAEHTLAWRADLSLTQELFDQRLPAGESIELRASLPPTARDGELRVRMHVAPREHYRRTFEDFLAREGERLDTATRSELRSAIDEARAAVYERVVAQWPLAAIAK